MRIITGLIAGAASALAGVAVFAMIAAFPTMWLWNDLMPELFGFKVVTFQQAFGLNLLSGILFRGGGSSKFFSSSDNRQ